MAHSRVQLPPGVRPPFKVFISGVMQREGKDYRVEDDGLIFPDHLVKEGKLGFWRWFLGAWGIGTYRRDDQVDISYDVEGRPVVAHALDIEPMNER